jgi:hypothetical protein
MQGKPEHKSTCKWTTKKDQFLSGDYFTISVQIAALLFCTLLVVLSLIKHLGLVFVRTEPKWILFGVIGILGQGFTRVLS